MNQPQTIPHPDNLPPDTQEEWRPCPRFNKYEVSSYGRFRNAETHTIRGQTINTRSGRSFLRLIPNNPTKRKKNRSWRAQTASCSPLIAEAFLGPRPKGYVVGFEDGDKTNLHISNLIYATIGHQIRKSHDNGTRKKTGPLRHLTTEQHAEIHKLWDDGKGISQVQIGKKLGINNATVSKVVNGLSHPRPILPVAPIPGMKGLFISVYELMLANPESTDSRVAGALGITRKSAQYHMYKLRKQAREIGHA